jgi:dipeptide transport system ATP-binding protein
MYLGRAVEVGAKQILFDTPLHPYTRALMAATPHIDPTARKVRMAVKGELPSPLDPPSGCAFHTRCPYATDRCKSERPELREVDQRQIACHRAEEVLTLEAAQTQN